MNASQVQRNKIRSVVQSENKSIWTYDSYEPLQEQETYFIPLVGLLGETHVGDIEHPNF